METYQTYQWVDSTLRGDTALMAVAVGGVWQGFANTGTTAPLVLYTQQASGDVLTINAIRLFANLLLQIKGVGQASQYGALVTIANRIDSLFGRVGPVGLSQGGVLSCYREQELAYEELVNGVQFSHLGGLYRILLQGS